MPIEIKTFLQDHLGDLSDFVKLPLDVEGVFAYESPSTTISITFAFEEDGQQLMIWFPGVDDPTEEDHMIFVKNNSKQGEQS